MTTTLLLQEIPSSDCRVLKLCDSSIYDDANPVFNAILEVTAPGFDCPIFFKVTKGFLMTLNSSNLKIVPSNTASALTCIPDGIYSIKYSISPNDRQFVAYDLMRNTNQLIAYWREIARLFHDRDRISKKGFEEKRAKLVWIKELMDAAKYSVEERGEAEEGMDMYREASSLLNHFTNRH
jgi:hypothetical protein